MKRSVTTSSPNGHDKQDILRNAEAHIAKVMYASGLDPERMDELTIDEIVEAVKNTFSGKIDSSKPIGSTMFVARHRSTLLLNLRWQWHTRSVVKNLG